MTSTLFLIFAALSLAATFVALVRVRHPAFLGFPIMMTGWLTSEYPRFHIAWQAVAAVVFIVVGALDRSTGVVAVALLLLSWAGLARAEQIIRRARPAAEAALRESLGGDYLDRLAPDRLDRLRSEPEPGLVRRPLHQDPTGVEIERDLAYGADPKRNLLDIYMPAQSAGPAPVVIQIHGGAWVIGHKMQQAQPLLYRLARAGYVAVSINYRLGPRHRFPDQIIDVKRAIGWVRENIGARGGDSSRIVLTGGSAGGHLASLAALTPGRADFQPGFEEIDTSVSGCVPLYGPADFRDRHGIRGRLASMEPFLSRMVMPGPVDDHAELWDMVSPIANVRPDAPPFFIIQGANDVLVWREEARQMVSRLREISRQPVVYWEVPGAQHAFDTFNSVRSAAAVDAIERFVGWVTAPVPAAPTELR
ncbi:MAG: alpha/beta hydrolase [Acidimicrobiia bacterium]|nr:alpha/beta hydrolase [Acidimicrobiia bacterium]